MRRMGLRRVSLYMFLLCVVAVVFAIGNMCICFRDSAQYLRFNALQASVGDAQDVDGVGGTTLEDAEKTIPYTQFSDLRDLILYEYLMFVRDGKYPETEELTNNPLKENDFATITSLDLSDVRDGEERISNVDMLGLFNFAELKDLNLSQNELTEIQAVTFAGMTSLENLNLEGNNLTTLEFGNLQSVKNLYANGNSLTAVDLSILAENGQAELCYNQITDIRKLNLQSDGKGARVDVYGNKIDNFLSGKYDNYDLTIGFQYEYAVYNEKNAVTIYKSTTQQGYYLDCVNTKTLEHFRVDDSQVLAPATYEITMCNESGALSYKTLTLKIVKSAPTFAIADMDGNALDLSKVITKETKITFNSNDANYNVVYSINGGSFVEGNSVILNKSGTYSFSVYAKSSVGDNSQTYSFTVQLRIDNNNFLQTLGIIMAIFAFAMAVYGVMYFLNRRRIK